MKVKITKSSNKSLWYNNIQLPIEVNAEAIRTNGLFQVIDGPFKTNYVWIEDCEAIKQFTIIDSYLKEQGRSNNLFEEQKSYEKSKQVREFVTGAKRDSDEDKPYCHNLQGYTRLRFGYLTRLGADRYGDGNFLKGFPKEDAIKSNDRHWAKYLDGDRSEDHLAAIIFNTQLIMLEEKREGVEADYYFKLKRNEGK